MKKQYILFASILLMANFSALAQDEEIEPCVTGAVIVNEPEFHSTFLCDDGVRGTIRTYSPESPITVEFHNSTPPNSTALAPGILRLYDKYWSVIGDNTAASVSLEWETGYLDNVLGYYELRYLRIVGFNGTEWVAFNSYIPDNVMSYDGNGSVRIYGGDADLTLYSAFTLALSISDQCGGTDTTVGFSTSEDNTFENGVWSNGDPGYNNNLTINSDFTGTLYANSIILNANIILPEGSTLFSAEGFTGDGKVIMNDSNNIIQENQSGNAPNIQITKTTSPMRRYDYIFLSNPIDESVSFFNQLLSNDNVAVFENEQLSAQPLSAFQQMRTFDAAGTIAINADASNTPVGRGFSATVRSQAPYSISNDAGAWYEQKYPIQITIEGRANNGIIPVEVPNEGWLRIGNPYPDAISGESLLAQFNDKMGKTLYYWTFATARGSLVANTYTQSDFTTYNFSGGAQARPDSDIPNGIIGMMESVLVKSKVSTNRTTIYLTNCERISGGLDKQNNTSSNNGKYRLNLEGSLNSFSQILIAYDPVNGTVDFDNGYDSARLQGQSSELSSLIDNKRYTIQTRGSFSSEDVVNLKLDKRLEETFTITLATKEGLFTETPIILHDKIVGIYHDLTVGPYAFIQDYATDTQRFNVVYESPMLNTNTFKTVSAFAFISNNTLNAQANQNISEIAVYDMSGRLIKVFSNIQESLFTASFLNSNGIYIAKIKLSDGTVVNQKLMK